MLVVRCWHQNAFLSFLYVAIWTLSKFEITIVTLLEFYSIISGNIWPGLLYFFVFALDSISSVQCNT